MKNLFITEFFKEVQKINLIKRIYKSDLNLAMHQNLIKIQNIDKIFMKIFKFM